MIELFGLQLGTVFQGGTLAAVLIILAGLATVWIKGIPDRLRATNEGRASNSAELAQRYKAWRTEVHDLKNEVSKAIAEQAMCGRALAEALAINRPVLFLIRLLVREVKRLDPDSPIVTQAESTMVDLGQALDNTKRVIEEINGEAGK